MNTYPGPSRLLLVATLALGVVTVVLGSIGLYYAVPPGTPVDWPKLLYETAGLLLLQSPALDCPPSIDNWAFGLARISGTLVALLGAAGVALGLSRDFRDAVVRIAFRLSGSRAAVVVGLGTVGSLIVRSVRADRRPVFGVTLDAESADAAASRKCGAVVVAGDAAKKNYRLAAGLHLATEVFIATGNDALNLEIAGGILADRKSDEVHKRRRSPMTCYVRISSPEYSRALGPHRILQWRDQDADVEFQGFNLHEQDARDCLLNPKTGILRGAAATSHVLHVTLIGFGTCGQTMALQLGRLAHFKSCNRLRLTIVDEFAGSDARFLARHPAFCPDPSFSLVRHIACGLEGKDNWGSRQWRPVDANYRSDDPQAVEYAVNAEFIDIGAGSSLPGQTRDILSQRFWPAAPLNEPSATHRVVVSCFDDEQKNFETAVWLREWLEAERIDRAESKSPKIPVHVRLSEDSGLWQWLRESPDFKSSAAVALHRYSGSSADEIYGRISQPDLIKMAAKVQEVYDRRIAFDDLLPVFQTSNLDVAAHGDIKLDAIGYRRRKRTPNDSVKPFELDAEQLGTLAHMEHNRWMAERLIAGWRFGKKGPAEPSGVQHENRRRLTFVTWEQLASQEPEMAKDVNQVRALRAMYEVVGDTIDSVPQS